MCIRDRLRIANLNRFNIYLETKEIKDFLDLIIEFMQTSKEYSRSLLYRNFTEFLDKKNIDIGNLKSKLKKSTISFDRKKIDKELFNDNLEFSSLPNKNELEIFIKEFTENNFNNVTTKSILNGFNDTLELSINYFNKINYGNKKDEKLIILDATADKEILKCFGFNVVKEIEFNIKSDNLEVIQDFSHTFTTSSQKDKDGNFNDKYIDVYKNLADENTFLLTPKETRLNLETLDLPCRFGNYQRDDKATNEYKDCTKAIITPPKSSDEVNFDEVKMLRPDINNFETRKVYVGTGFIKDGLELFNEEIEFIEPFINRVVEQTKQVLMVQGLSRIRRDFTTNKTVIILGNISLKKYGIIPNEIRNFLEENKSKNKIYDLLNTDLVDFFSKNDILFNQNLDNYLLSNVTTENKNKVITLTDSTIQGFEDKNKALMLSITMFVQVSIKEYINGDTNKHSYNSNTDNLSLFTKKIKDRLIKSFDLKKSFFDLDNKRHYFYYKSTSDIKEIKAKINFELNLTTPAPAIPENIMQGSFDETNNINLIQDNSFEAEEIENTKDILLTEIVKSFCNEELKKALSLNRTIDKQYFNWIERNCVLDGGSYRNITFFNKLKNDFIDLSDNDISTVLVMVHNFFIENRERFNNDRLEMKGFISMDNDSNDFKYTSKIIAEGDKRFNDFKYKRIKELKIIDTECLMKINSYLAEKNISDNELLVREWVFKLILDEKEAINNQILFKLNNMPSNVIQINRNKSKCEKEYLYKLAEDIYYLVKKSNYDIYIDVENKCWSDYFKHVFNNGDEYNYMIKHISLKFSISSELSQKLFDYYPNQLQEFINLA